MTLIVSASHGCGEILDKTDQPETSQPPKKNNNNTLASKVASLNSPLDVRDDTGPLFLDYQIYADPLAAKYYCFARKQFLACMS